jgi:hypothetical protein
MKKFSALFLIFTLLLLCSCTKKQEDIVITSNMLEFSNNEKTYLGIRARYDDIINVIKTEVTALEQCHNDEIRYSSPDDYFLNDEYFLASFDPFDLSSLSYTDNFNDIISEENASQYYELEAADRDTVFSKTDSSYILKFSSEELSDIYSVNYDVSSDSFNYSHIIDTPQGESTEEFVEFVNVSANTYAIQSLKERCYISFDESGHIIEFYYSELKDNNTYKLSLYENGYSSLSPEKWVCKGSNDNYISIVNFSDGVLTHYDFSSGEEKKISINESDYAVAFYK